MIFQYTYFVYKYVVYPCVPDYEIQCIHFSYLRLSYLLALGNWIYETMPKVTHLFTNFYTCSHVTFKIFIYKLITSFQHCMRIFIIPLYFTLYYMNTCISIWCTKINWNQVYCGYDEYFMLNIWIGLFRIENVSKQLIKKLYAFIFQLQSVFCFIKMQIVSCFTNLDSYMYDTTLFQCTKPLQAEKPETDISLLRTTPHFGAWTK